MRYFLIVIITFVYLTYNLSMIKKINPSNNQEQLFSSKENNDNKKESEINAHTFINKSSDQFILMNNIDIQKYNKETLRIDETLHDLDSIATLTKEDIEKLINKYTLPSLPKYDGSKKISTNDTKKILDNRNLDKIVDINNVTKGIVVKRTNLKAFPTTLHFYDKPNMDNFDNLQESEIHVNTPLLIIHKSLDNQFSFVITPSYTGWILNDDIAFIKTDDWTYFTKPNQFAIITNPSVNVNSTYLDMGVWLPLIKISGDNYQLALPTKGDDGYAKVKKITLKNDVAHIGYLPYTKENVFIQAFKYLNVKYQWGGMDSGVDCSSFIKNIYQTFGFNFPRNSSSQRESLRLSINLANLSNQAKLQTIKNQEPLLLYQPGHVMLYLGTYQNKHYIIHASGSALKVTLTILDDSTYLKNITKAIKIQ